MIPALIGKVKAGDAEKKAKEMLDFLKLSDRMTHKPAELSGGEKQRVAVARAVISGSKIILADEPTGNLDSRSSHVIMEELSELHKKGNTIIMVTHNPNLTSYASRVINMLDGKIASDTKIRVDTKSANRSVKIPLNRKLMQEKAEKTKAKEKSPAAKRTSVKATKKPAKKTSSARAKKEKKS